MKKLSDLRIVTQLGISFGIIFILFLILGVNSWHQSNQLAQQTSDLYEHPLVVRRAISDLKIDVRSMRLELLNILQSDSDREKQDALTNMALYQADAANNFELLKDHYLGPKSDIEESQLVYLKWISLFEQFKGMVRAGKSNADLNRFDDSVNMEKVGEQLFDSIRKIDLFAFNKAEQLINHAKEVKKSLDMHLIILLVCILALLTIIIVIFSKNILLPIKQLTGAHKSFGEGKLDMRSSYSSQNELGELSDSFNSLASTIQNEFNFKDRSVRLNSFLLKGLQSDSLLEYVLEPLMKLTNAQVGAIYLLNDEKSHFVHFESIGLPSTFIPSFSVRNHEGEFGIALTTKEISHISNIPEDTNFAFSAISGSMKPKEIITIPLLDKTEVIAMISLSSLSGFDAVALRLITDMQSTLTAWMNAILSSRKIRLLSDNLQMQNRELESQKTELASQAHELLEQNAELEMQKKQLDESNHLKSSFLSNMSHELRTPLNSVIALSGVLNRRLENIIPPEEYSYLHVIERNGKQLLMLINDILDLSRIESGYEEIQVNRFDVNQLLKEVVELIEPQSIEKEIVLSCDRNDALPFIHSDYEKCRHILQNIVVNAIKFTETGSVKIGARAGIHSIYIDVTDTGIGIDHAFLSEIFDEFRQADNSNARKHGGTGLGLSIAKKYAELLGGTITVESEKGKGSKFSVILPLHSPFKQETLNNPMSQAHRISSPQPSTASEKKTGEKTILLVEDSEAAIIQMKEMLASQGYAISIAHNGKEALEQIALKIPDAMILDLMMPDVDGFEVLKRIRNRKETAKLPVIILTAKFVTKEELAFLKHNNVHQLIQKGDVKKEQLLTFVSQMIFPEAKEGIQSAESASRPSQYHLPTILVVEDNSDNMLTIKALLEGMATVIEVNDGGLALEMALLHNPDLVLLDIALPGENGEKILRKMRKTDRLQLIPVIAVSASAMKGDREHFIAIGFDDYISKPIDHEIFNNTIGNVLAKRSHQL